jgi:hypothetical protein
MLCCVQWYSLQGGDYGGYDAGDDDLDDEVGGDGDCVTVIVISDSNRDDGVMMVMINMIMVMRCGCCCYRSITSATSVETAGIPDSTDINHNTVNTKPLC